MTRKERRTRRKRKILVLSGVFVIALTAAAAFAAWNVGGSGSGTAKAVTVQNLTTSAATPTAALYPGISNSPLKLTVNNPNAFPVTVTDVNLGTGSITAAGGNGSCTTTGVTYASQSGLSQVIPANGSATFTTPGGVSMDNTSENGCQNATFTVPVDLVANS